MTQINWGLSGGNGFQNALATGMQFGQQIKADRQEQEYRNALAEYDPANPDSVKAITRVDPRLGMQLRQQAAQQQVQQREQQQLDMGTFRKLLGKAAESPEGWAQAMGAAQQLGLDISGVPQQYDPEWAKQQLFITEALDTPQGQEALSASGKVAVDMGYRPGTPEYSAKVQEIFRQEAQKFIPVQPGGYVATVDPSTGQARYVVAPSGGAPQGGIPSEAIEALKRGEGTPEQFDQMFGAGASASIMGGTGGNAGGGFLAGQ